MINRDVLTKEEKDALLGREPEPERIGWPLILGLLFCGWIFGAIMAEWWRAW